MNTAVNESDIVCERTLASYDSGIGSWSTGTLGFALHFYEGQTKVSDDPKWQAALALVRAELVYRKLKK